MTEKSLSADLQKGELESLKEWYRYNSYVRRRYFKLLKGLGTEELMRDRGASYPSVLDIFIHVLDAYRFWFLLASNDKVKGSEELKVSGMEETGRIMEEVDSQVLSFVEGLRPEDLLKSFEFTDDERKRIKYPVRWMLYHLIEEELQHRGELNALLWQMNLDPPVTSWRRWKVEIGEKF